MSPSTKGTRHQRAADVQGDAAHPPPAKDKEGTYTFDIIRFDISLC